MRAGIRRGLVVIATASALLAAGLPAAQASADDADKQAGHAPVAATTNRAFAVVPFDASAATNVDALKLSAGSQPELSANDEAVTISVIGDLPKGKFNPSELRNVGVTRDQIAAIKRGQARVSSSSASTLSSPSISPRSSNPNDPYQVMATWNDKKGKKVGMRWGNSRWGWTKINNKHNLTTAAVKVTTKYPKTRKVESRSSIVYTTPVKRVKCYVIGNYWCKVVETKTVKVVMNPMKLNDKRPKGAITAYCKGVTWCPSWVKNAVNT